MEDNTRRLRRSFFPEILDKDMITKNSKGNVTIEKCRDEKKPGKYKVTKADIIFERIKEEKKFAKPFEAEDIKSLGNLDDIVRE